MGTIGTTKYILVSSMDNNNSVTRGRKPRPAEKMFPYTETLREYRRNTQNRLSTAILQVQPGQWLAYEQNGERRLLQRPVTENEGLDARRVVRGRIITTFMSTDLSNMLRDLVTNELTGYPELSRRIYDTVNNPKVRRSDLSDQIWEALIAVNRVFYFPPTPVDDGVTV